MKTPEEIKKGLECCHRRNSCRRKCPYDGPSHDIDECTTKLAGEALAYIRQLESRLAQVERERDAMSYDMHQLQGELCAYCKNLYRPKDALQVTCRVFGDGYGVSAYSPLICGSFKWRGPCPENSKEETK